MTISKESKEQVRWYAVYVRSRYEKKVYQLLLENGLTSFLPLVETVRRWSDRKKRVEEPLIKSYVFVKINYHKEHVAVLETDGVVKFIGIGRTPSVISERDIAWLKRLTHEPDAIGQTVASIPRGKKVRVLAGPFKDFEGVVQKEGREDRLVVYFDSIMQGVEITIAPELLAQIESPSVAAQPDRLAEKVAHESGAAVKHLMRP
ncbi:MAG TPA: UpxY family transcription antiterminator [Chlorobaculum parvum]|uniref:UpxY family transcription antiterminator n=1 Tax=Chlorobaculum parvum TaxID=274539 RepID=A0A7C5DF80_9CHLB|nr:UpxY family transcription antiterminator [Chlorobaculum parvum]